MKMNKTTKAILWIVSGVTLLFITVFLQIIINFVFSGSGQNSIVEDIAKIFTWVTGTLGFVLFFIGPIVGILMLVKKETPPSQ